MILDLEWLRSQTCVEGELLDLLLRVVKEARGLKIQHQPLREALFELDEYLSKEESTIL